MSDARVFSTHNNLVDQTLRILNSACNDYYLLPGQINGVVLQALPYVALLILMLFFIYAVVGMQVYPHTHIYTLMYIDSVD